MDLGVGCQHNVVLHSLCVPYSDPVTGAHFEFKDMCVRLDKILKKRFQEEMQSSTTRKSLNKDFLRESQTSNGGKGQTDDNQ